jgi:chloride channel 2
VYLLAKDNIDHWSAAYIAWTFYTVIAILLTVAFVNRVSPQACGPGIPEMKTIIRGVVLKEYLTISTLIAKMIGIAIVVGCGMPVGKEVFMLLRHAL